MSWNVAISLEWQRYRFIYESTSHSITSWRNVFNKPENCPSNDGSGKTVNFTSHRYETNEHGTVSDLLSVICVWILNIGDIKLYLCPSCTRYCRHVLTQIWEIIAKENQNCPLNHSEQVTCGRIDCSPARWQNDSWYFKIKKLLHFVGPFYIFGVSV